MAVLIFDICVLSELGIISKHYSVAKNFNLSFVCKKMFHLLFLRKIVIYGLSLAEACSRNSNGLVGDHEIRAFWETDSFGDRNGNVSSFRDNTLVRTSTIYQRNCLLHVKLPLKI